VDINSASAEITRLALWLHTARGDKPLSSLDTTIREGNSLIGSDFFKGQINLAFYDEVEKERINAFDWKERFPEVFARGGFDAVVGNPSYVKLQNFRKVHADMAEFLRSGRQDIPGYTSTQSGNFDLYLPFIEKGLSILNEHGRLGFIAPSLWTVNEYGAALRAMIADGQNLDRWLDFKAHQIFEESRSTRRFSSIRSTRTIGLRLHSHQMASWPVIRGLVKKAASPTTTLTMAIAGCSWPGANGH